MVERLFCKQMVARSNRVVSTPCPLSPKQAEAEHLKRSQYGFDSRSGHHAPVVELVDTLVLETSA